MYEPSLKLYVWRGRMGSHSWHTCLAAYTRYTNYFERNSLKAYSRYDKYLTYYFVHICLTANYGGITLDIPDLTAYTRFSSYFWHTCLTTNNGGRKDPPDIPATGGEVGEGNQVREKGKEERENGKGKENKGWVSLVPLVDREVNQKWGEGKRSNGKRERGKRRERRKREREGYERKIKGNKIGTQEIELERLISWLEKKIKLERGRVGEKKGNKWKREW